MKISLIDTILLSIGVGLFFIGIHQSIYNGIKASYWLFMFSTGFIFWFRYRRATATTPTETQTTNTAKGKKKKS